MTRGPGIKHLFKDGSRGRLRPFEGGATEVQAPIPHDLAVPGTRPSNGNLVLSRDGQREDAGMSTRTVTVIVSVCLASAATVSADPQNVLTGAAAFGDWTTNSPGVRRHITVDAMPRPNATRSASRGPRVVRPPPGATPKVPPGFSVSVYASGLSARG